MDPSSAHHRHFERRMPEGINGGANLEDAVIKLAAIRGGGVFFTKRLHGAIMPIADVLEELKNSPNPLVMQLDPNLLQNNNMDHPDLFKVDAYAMHREMHHFREGETSPRDKPPMGVAVGKNWLLLRDTKPLPAVYAKGPTAHTSADHHQYSNGVRVTVDQHIGDKTHNKEGGQQHSTNTLVPLHTQLCH
eukprot:GDKI01000444.1.p1 GENE.GDKI01000444.1~~GDKI01000444.1.p1  ORF type:complete len:190 (-),score=22.45 GDKI01000444.1:262-831(-)